jgi:hypothetical protein
MGALGKYIYYCFYLVAVLFPFVSIGQNEKHEYLIDKKRDFDDVKTIVIKTNLFEPMWGNIPFSSEFSLSLEHQSSLNQSADITISAFTRNVFIFPILAATNPNIENIKMRGYGLSLSYKFFLKGKNFQDIYDGINSMFVMSKNELNVDYAPFGFYIAPIFRLARGEFYIDGRFGGNNYESITFTKQDMGIVAGAQVQLFENIVMDCYSGFGRKFNYLEESNNGSVGITASDIPFYGGKYKFYLNIRFGLAF